MITRYPLISFFVLAFVFSWWPWPLDVLGLAPSPIIGFGPFIAAVVVLAATGGRPAVGALLHQMVRWRVRPWWYATALFVPIVLAVAATLLNVMLSAATPTRDELEACLPSFRPSSCCCSFLASAARGRSRVGADSHSRSCRRVTRRCRPPSCSERSGPSDTFLS